ncbi:hypothetical protein ACFQFC_04430 [Amorphoplanes digitatis]|uniref:Uncharacterized protein n=1 Tax=Actinoplanes digitatis TaxID=1868 RepID=A0A7W7MR59_9ACTN|nr:hypothetical protein [Actinoplanes digitatis]MBB4763432.1 hypothetical protein [Actinoplanes digitatis]GID92251.1 hypothetical protein Adi01nite_16630 [Actinoplanes digitatis]
MRRPTYRRAGTRRGPDRRIIAAVAALVAFGGVITVTQISNADESKTAACQAPAATTAPPSGQKAASDPKVGTYTDKDGDVQHKGDGQLAKGEQAPKPEAVEVCKTGNTTAKQVNGLTILANSCEDSDLTPHDGFQNGNRCVSTEFGEVGAQENNPTLLITEFPETVRANTPFTLKVSTRNLIRDRFLAAGQGGYYVESSVLQDGLVRGHFHTACRMLSSTTEAVDPAPVPAFFVATEDRKGSRTPDTVTIQVPGLPQEGIAQCASWAGDGSHRIPMMQRANQTPALDAVRVKVEGGRVEEPEDPPATTPPADNGGNNGGNNGGGNNGNNGGGDNGNNGGGNNGGGNNGGGDDGNDDGDDGEEPNPGDTAGTATPKTGTDGTPPKTGTVTIPPKTTAASPKTTTAAPKPAKTTKPATGDDESNGSGDEDEGDEPARNAAGNTAEPEPTETEEPAAEAVNSDDGAPDAGQDDVVNNDVQAENNSRLALTGANSMTIILGGALLVLCGLVLIGATRRRRNAARD